MEGWAFLLLATALLAGCAARDEAIMPLKSGSKWTYQYRAGLVSKVDEIAVVSTAETPVGRGWMLDGPGGSTKLAWGEGKLYAAQLAGTTYLPPLPIYADKESKWTGEVVSGHRVFDGTAILTSEDTKIRVGTKSEKGRLATLQVTFGSQNFELLIWFVRGIGIVRLEERSKGQLNSSLDYLKGP